MNIITRWFLSALAVMVTSYLLPGIMLKSFFVALVVAVVLGFFNSIIRPILILLTLPIQFLTLGLFTLFINAAIVLLTAKIVPGFEVNGFGSAFLFSIILWLVNMVLNIFEPNEEEKDRRN